MIYAVKDLRNAVAHNNTIFDTRFQTSRINKRLISLLETEVGISYRGLVLSNRICDSGL